MAILEFTTPTHTDQSAVYLQQAIGQVAQFQRKHSVHITSMPWETVWSDLVNIGLHKTGADMSEVGTTWISSFVAMNALRPFSSAEIARMGGQAAFVPPAWRSASIVGGQQLWAIPWMADARVIYYWRDMLDEAGVEAETAFQTFDSMATTLDRLRANGVAHPWITATYPTRDTLYNSLSWVWGARGEVVSTDGTQPLFHLPEARAGLRAYFDLQRFLPPEPALLTNAQVATLFQQRQAAVTMSGPWLFNLLRTEPEALARLGVALPPGPSFVGGMNLIIWQHVSRALEQATVELVQHLATGQIQAEYSQTAGFLPVRRDLLAQPPFSTDPYYRVFVEALESGRSHNPVARWGLIEDRMTSMLSNLWAEIRQNPTQNLETVIARPVEMLAKRLELTLQAH